MNSQSPAIGIDFGTSNSKMAWYNPTTKQADFILNAEGKPETPSVVYFGENETLVGDPALEMLEDEEERECVILSVKRELVTTPLLAVRERSIKPTGVVAEILRKLKRDAENLQFHQQVTRVVITYPASFGPLEWDKIREAAQLAGFTEVEILEEQVAAALAYAQMGLQIGRYGLVYDLRGGTFDLTVLNYGDDGAFWLALEPQGIKRCGGDDFDEALYNYCDKIAQQKLKRPISLMGKRELHFLQQCRQRKGNLSTAERRVFKSYLEPGAFLFQCEIDRPRFESLIRATIEETVRRTKVLLEQASTEGRTVDTLVLIGGSSRMPLVQRLLEKSLPLRPLQWQNRDVAVALDFAYYAQNKWGGLKSKKTSTDQYQRAVEGASSDKQLDKMKSAPTEGQRLISPLARRISAEYNVDLTQVKGSSSHGSVTKDDVLSNLEQNTQNASQKPIASKQELVKPQPESKPESFILTRTLTGHSDTVYSVAISRDGLTLASGSRDRTIKLWNPHTGKLLHTLTGHANAVNSVAISPDGQTIVSGSVDKTIKIWRKTNSV